MEFKDIARTLGNILIKVHDLFHPTVIRNYNAGNSEHDYSIPAPCFRFYYLSAGCDYSYLIVDDPGTSVHIYRVICNWV